MSTNLNEHETVIKTLSHVTALMNSTVLCIHQCTVTNGPPNEYFRYTYKANEVL